MAGAFGFQKYQQQGTPSSEAVGMALLQQGQGAGQMAPAPSPYGPGQMVPPAMHGMGPGPMATDPMADQRAEGAYRMTSAGQIGTAAGDDMGEDGHSANAVNIAVGEALTRLGSGYSTNPNPYKDRARSIQQLQQLGLSQTEAMLLAKTGGV